MTPGRAAIAFSAWPAIIVTGLFVLVTHYVGVTAGAPLEFLALDTSLALLFLVAGAIAWQRRPTSRTRRILVLSAALWSLGSYGPTGLQPVWALGFAFEGYYDVALALLALTFPAAALGRAGRVAMAVLFSAFLIRSASRLLFLDPPRTYPSPFGGPSNPLAFFESAAAFEFFELWASVAVLAAVIVVAVLSVRRLAASHALTRAVIGPMIRVRGGHGLCRRGGRRHGVVRRVRRVDADHPRGGPALHRLAGPRRPGHRAARLPARDPAPALEAPRCPRLRRRLAQGDAPEEVDAALAAYIENRELADLLTAQLAELRASRARLVAAGDAERRRIERALHDGAQQHLTGIAIRLEDARQMNGIAPDGLARKLDETVAELRDAINELRELARGIHPTILSEAGLEPALATLARRSPVPVDLRVALDGHVPLPTEVTAYYVVAEGLTNVARSARATRVDVTVERRDGGIAVGVRDDGIGGADATAGSGISGLEDRVRALNGTFRIDSPPGAGTTLDVWLPCE